MNEERIAFANTLRGPAALAVLLSHYIGAAWAQSALHATAAGLDPESTEGPVYVRWIAHLAPADLGQFGVGLFFLISGFVIPFSFRHYSRSGFAIARFFRLWPTYAIGFLITVGAIYVTHRISGTVFPYSVRQIAIHAVLELRELTLSPPVDAIIWTLEIEVTFYLVCMSVAPWLRAGSLGVFLVPVGLFLACFGLRYWAAETAVAQQIKALAQAHAAYIIFMFAGVAFNFQHRKLLRFDQALIVAASAVVAFLTLLMPMDAARFAWDYAAASLVFGAAFIWKSVVPDGPVWRFFADISYPLYVTHGLMGIALIQVMLRVGIGPLQSIVATAAVAVFGAWVLHLVVEAPSRRFGRTIALSLGWTDKAEPERRGAPL